jgi:glyoxylase-like metal-dependent hydrolase (beta-lactamase superfamily II)
VRGVVRLGSDIVSFYAVAEAGRWTLLDAGLPGFRPQLEANGIPPEAIEAVVLTHAHGDHMGLAETLRRAGARVYVHEADRELATGGESFGTTEAPMARYLRHPMAWRLYAHFLRNRGGRKPSPVAEVTTFSDGEQLDVPGRPRVIHTPGHTEGHSVFQLEDGSLVVGDLLCSLNPLTGARGPQILPRALNRSSARMLDALGRLENLDADTVWFGHGEPWHHGIASAVGRARATGPS